MRVRKIIYQNATNFRTVDPTFYTAAAFAAVALGDILAVQVPGSATTVNYVAVKKVAEKQPSRGASRQLAD
jgi:trans-aconitate methyltransferase